MSKKEFLELLISSYGLTPKNVHHYKTDGCDGAYQVNTGWKGVGLDSSGDCVIAFEEPDGFNMAVHEILQQAARERLNPIYVKHQP